jgi:tetratricopeptide (TPR) repeat protein
LFADELRIWVYETDLKSHVLHESADKLIDVEPLQLASQVGTRASEDMDFKELHEKLEDWTRSGKRSLVIECLKALDRTKLSLLELIVIAKIANRNHLYSQSLRYLFQEKQMAEEQQQPLPPELATTYSAALLGLGATEEAQGLLKTQLHHAPALFSYSLSHFSTWSYDSAIASFKKYLCLPTDPYMHLVGRINLVAAYIGTGDYITGNTLLTELMADIADNPQASILYANCWEIKSQIEIENKEYDQALESLRISKTVFKDQLTRYLLYVNKWEAVARLAKRPQSLEHQRALLNIKHQGQELRNWETIRDCDFQLARLTSNPELMERVLQGTPFKGYHLRLKKLYGLELQKKEDFTFVPGINFLTEKNTLKIDLTQPPEALVRLPSCLNLLLLLSHDFYKPPRFGVLHAGLHPGEHYNPFTSPQRIRNSILRLNKVNAELKNGIKVFVESGDVFIESSQGQGITIASFKTRFAKIDYLLKLLCTKMKGQRLSSPQVAQIMEISQRSAVTLLNNGIRKNRIQRFGKGKNTSYRVSNQAA